MNIKTVEKPKPLIAKDDIVCYKILKRDIRNWYCHWSTPCYWIPVPDVIINGEDMLRARGNESINDSSIYTGIYEVGEGFIHTFKNINSAIKQVEYWSNRSLTYYGLFECIIPKGEEYYEGNDNGGHLSYASNKIKFVEQVKL